MSRNAKTPALLAALCCSAFGGTYTVCTEPGACDFSDLQRALDRAQLGDTLVLRAGDTFSSADGFILQPKSGEGWLRIQSSRLNDLPEGRRVGREQAAAGLLPRIVTTGANAALRFGPSRLSVSVNTETDTLIANNHGFADGDEIVAGGNVASPYFCLGVNDPIRGNDCSADKVGTFNVRGRTGLQDGAAVYLFAQRMPEPFLQDTPYYVVNLVEAANLSKFQLAANPGGEPILPSTTAVGLSYTAAVTPLRYGQKVYVVNSTRNSFQVAAGPGGQPIDLTAARPGGSFSKGGLPVRNVAIEGVEITVRPGVFSWVLVYLGSGGDTSREHMPNGILVDRSYIHGNPGEMGPHQCVQINSHDVTIQNSTIRDCKSNYADAQAILVNASHGNIRIENNRLEASGETFMSGGAYPGPGVIPVGMVFRRNYFTKPLAWWTGIAARIVDRTTLQLRQAQRGEACPVAATRHPAAQCFVYDLDGNRYTFDSDLRITGPQGNGKILLMWDGGLKAVHNLAGLSCSAPIECVSANPAAWPATATRLQEITVASDAFTAITNYTPVIKNAFEVKHGKDILVEGNVLEHAWQAAQNSIFVLNVQAASNPSEPLNFWSESSDVVIRNNIIRKANTALGISGRSWLANRPEAVGLGFGGRHVLQNNLLIDFDARKWTFDTGGGYRGTLFFLQSATDVRIDHNTIIGSDHRLTFFASGNPPSNFVSLTNNIIVPREGVFSGVSGDGIASWQHAKSMKQNPDGVMSRNILLNQTGATSWTRPGVDYPDDTFLLRGTNPPSAVGFVDWLGGNFRLSEESPFTARCKSNCAAAATDERDIGADLDEIFALTNGVEEGLPEWSKRAWVRVEPSDTTALLSWQPSSGAPCEVRVYEGKTYASLIADVNPNNGLGRNLDTRATVGDGLRYFVIGQLSPLSPGKNYSYKLFCEGEIAVGGFQTAVSPGQRPGSRTR
jgi:hypothetical protein